MPSYAKFGEDKFVTVGGCRIHYLESGSGEPVLLIPGAWSNCRAWDRVVPLLCPSFRLLAFDTLGVGDSDKPQVLPGSPLESLLKLPVLGDLLIAIARTGLLAPRRVRLIAGQWYPHMTLQDKRDLKDQVSYKPGSASPIPWYWISISHKTCADFSKDAKSLQVPLLLYLRNGIRFFGTPGAGKPPLPGDLPAPRSHPGHPRRHSRPGIPNTPQISPCPAGLF